MAIGVLILGESNTGKTASLLNMNPDKTLLIQTIRKPLPFQWQKKGWSYFDKNNTDGNIYSTENPQKIHKAMVNTKKEIVVIDDFQYIMANEFMRRGLEKTYDKFTEIQQAAWFILHSIANINKNKRVYILMHYQKDDFGNIRAKTIGKMLDDKIVIEGMFSVVLRTSTENKYKFRTVNDGADLVRTPIDLFNESEIPNDLDYVDQAICKYYDINQEAITQDDNL